MNPFYKPIVVAPTKPSCSTTTSTSPLSNGFTCDASLMVENETLKKEVNEITRALGNAYGGDASLLVTAIGAPPSQPSPQLGQTATTSMTPALQPSGLQNQGQPPAQFASPTEQVS